jgi:DNA-binding NtrC family response regulator
LQPSEEPISAHPLPKLDLPSREFPSEEEVTHPRLRDRLHSFERERIEEALRECSGHQGKAASLLGISRRTLFNKMELYGIRRPRKSDSSMRPPSDKKPSD